MACSFLLSQSLCPACYDIRGYRVTGITMSHLSTSLSPIYQPYQIMPPTSANHQRSELVKTSCNSDSPSPPHAWGIPCRGPNQLTHLMRHSDFYLLSQGQVTEFSSFIFTVTHYILQAFKNEPSLRRTRWSVMDESLRK